VNIVFTLHLTNPVLEKTQVSFIFSVNKLLSKCCVPLQLCACLCTGKQTTVIINIELIAVVETLYISCLMRVPSSNLLGHQLS
jgi:hypothetical protein